MKNLLKKYFQILWQKNKFSASVQIQQRKLYLQYQQWFNEGKLIDIDNTGFRNFSQFEEDGKLLFLFAAIGMTCKSFVEIGADDGVNSNCANLYFNFDWRGLFIDGNPKSIDRGRYFYNKYPHPWFYKPKFRQAKVTRENINEILSQEGFTGEIGLLSIDIDGNDYWIWDKINVINPQVVVIETHVEFGMNNIIVPYDPDYVYPGKHPVYHGASPVAMEKLGKKKGYRLVGANELGFNFIFVREDLIKDLVPAKKVEDVLKHPSVKECYEKFKPIEDWEYVEG